MLDVAGTKINSGNYVAYRQNEIFLIGRVNLVFEKTSDCTITTLDISIIDSKVTTRIKRLKNHKIVVVPEPSFLIQDWLSGNYVFDEQTTKLVRYWLNTGKFPFEDTKQEYYRG